jgi:KDO2-lipid IV(A) lauroyltransferase
MRFEYYFIRALTFPISLLPYSWIHALGRFFGLLCFYTLTRYRKKTLSNLSMAKALHLTQKQIFQIAKESFQNLAINALEYAKFARETDFSRIIECENPEKADALYKQGKGIIFFCAHQSNWEALFLDGTTRMKGIAIGKPIKNKLLYNWVVSIREKNGGRIIAQGNALKEGLRALKQGHFFGILGDQGMPVSGYCYPFLGRTAWTTTAPALLAYRTNSPIIFAATRRVKGKYKIHYSDPIWPDLTKPAESEVTRLMDETLHLLEVSIKKNPGQWLWQHNRWKQQTPKKIFKKYRHDCVCAIVPPNFDPIHIETLRTIYEKEHLVLLAPENYPTTNADETIPYKTLKETLLDDLRFKIVFNFTDYKPISRHYRRLSAFEVLQIDPKNLTKVLCRAS